MSQYRGRDVAVYTYINFVENNLYSGIGLGDYSLWIAQIDINEPQSSPIWGDINLKSYITTLDLFWYSFLYLIKFKILFILANWAH